MLRQVDISFERVDEILKCDHFEIKASNKTS